jgi:hypothetical protein
MGSSTASLPRQATLLADAQVGATTTTQVHTFTHNTCLNAPHMVTLAAAAAAAAALQEWQQQHVLATRVKSVAVLEGA